MREPDLVFRAQQAAAALERAWERWREMHGMTADPMPAISSYVGYSLEEPWGQPRVVFGLSADDAEQLVALLNRHDCIGPVQKTIAAGQGDGEVASEASAQPDRLAADRLAADRLASVPRQAPSLAADAMAAQSQDAELAGGLSLADTADHELEQDGPVFRQLMAAVRKVSGARVAVHAGAAPGAADAGTAVGVLAADAAERAGAGNPTGAADSPSSNATSADDASDPADSDDDGDVPAAASGAASGDDGATEAGSAAAADTAQHGEFAAAGEAAPAADTTKDAGIVLEAAPADVDNARPDAADDPQGEPTGGPGPLAQAASAARVEAEARIRAAMGQAKVAEPSASGDPDGAGPQDADPGRSAASETKPPATLEAAPPADAAPTARRGSVKKPPGEAGLEAPPVAKPGSADESVEAGVEAADGGHPHDISASLGRPESEADDGSGPAIGTFGFGSDLVGSVGSYHEPGKRSDQPQDRASSGYPRRNRGNRSYSIPRLSKTRRAGVSPGA